MSDCPDCENEGFTLEWMPEDHEDDLKGHYYRLPCRNWRHRSKTPTLGQIAHGIRQQRSALARNGRTE